MSTFVEHHQKLIHKYPINLKAAFSEIGWARGSRVVLVDNQDGDLTVWVEHDADARLRKRVVDVWPTGGLIDSRLEHLGSAIVPPYVWHVYAEPEAQWESRTRSMSDD